MGDELGWFIDDYVYEEVEEKDEKGHTYTKRQRIVERDSLSMKTYKEEIIKQGNEIKTIADIKAIVEEVNDRPDIKGKVKVYREAEAAVNSLFKEDRYDYDEAERLKENLTQEEINEAKNAVERVDDVFTKKEWLQSDIEYVEYLFLKKDADEVLSNYKSEVTLPETIKIGDSVSELFYDGEEVQGFDIKVTNIGERLEDYGHYQSVEGEAQYLGADESSNVILNQYNTTDVAKTEYVNVRFYVGNRYLEIRLSK